MSALAKSRVCEDRNDTVSGATVTRVGKNYLVR